MPVVVTNLKTDIPSLFNAFNRFFRAWNRNTDLDDTKINLLRNDPTVTLGLGMIKEPIKGLNYKWDVDTNEEQGKKQLEYAKLFIDPFIQELSSKILLGLDYGRNSILKVYTQAEMDGRDFLVPKRYVNPKPENVTPLEGKFKQFTGVEYDNIKYDVTKVIHVVWAGEFREEELFGKSVLTATYQAYYRYQLIWLYYVRYLEKQAAATVKILYPPDEIDEDENRTNNASDAEALGEGLKSGSTIALSSIRDIESKELLWDAEYMEAPTSGSEFINAMDKHETLMLRSLLVPDAALTRPGGAVGTLAESKERGESFTTSLENKSKWRDWNINTQVVDQLMAINFGEDVIPMKMVSEPIIDEDRILLGKLFEKMTTDSRVSEMITQMFADRYDWDIDEVMELIIAKREILTPELPAEPDNRDEQPSGGQQEEIEMESAINRSVLEMDRDIQEAMEL